MFDVIVAIISALFTGTLTTFVMKKYTLTDLDTETVKKVFQYQKEIYLSIVASKDGKPVSIDAAKIQINQLLIEIQEDDELFLMISEELRQYLAIYKKHPSLKESIQNVQRQIDADFEETKYKLGYPSNKYEFSLFKIVKGFQLFTCLTVIFFFLVLMFKWYVDGDTLMTLFYWTMFSVVFSLLTTIYTSKHPIFNQELNKGLLTFPIDLITKIQNTIIQLFHQHKQ